MRSQSSPSRLFAVGDIHGCARELELLLQDLKLQRDDTIVFLGDYVDRGPDAKGVISLIVDLQKRHNVIALKGNHEAMFLDFLERPESTGAGLFVLNGGSTTLASYAGEGGTFEIPDEHIRFLYELKMSYETPTHFFVHAGVTPNRPLAALAKPTPEDEMAMLWIRSSFLNSDYNWGKIIVHGHTPVGNPEMKPNRINLDTGCVYGGDLTAYEVNSGTFYQVEKGPKEDTAITRDIGASRVAMRFSGRLPVEAGKPGGPLQTFETLNYNQFGLLMAETIGEGEPPFVVGDAIEGRIVATSPAPGVHLGPKNITFSGEVVRVESRNNLRVYGVRMTRVDNADKGYEWVDRSRLPE